MRPQRPPTRRLVSPFGALLSPRQCGAIGRSSVTSSALVTANQAKPLATIQDLSKVYVDITQTSSEMVRLNGDLVAGTVGAVDHADITSMLDDGSLYPENGRVQFSDFTVAPVTGAVTIRTVFNNPNCSLTL